MLRLERGPLESPCRRILARMWQLHHGPQRRVPEVRHLRRHDGVQLSRGAAYEKSVRLWN
jgi:hypothetical protein